MHKSILKVFWSNDNGKSDGSSRRASHGEVFDGSLSSREEREIFTPINHDIPPEIHDPSAPADKVYVDLDGDDDDFPNSLNAYDRWAERNQRIEQRKKNKRRTEIGWKIWSVVRVFVIIAACLFITVFALKTFGSKLINRYILPVDPNDPTPIIVEIPTGSGASAIAKILYEAGGEDASGLIPHKAIFKIYVDFIGKSSRLQAGTYVLSRNMSIPEIVDVICKGNPPRETVKFTVPEGLTLESIADKLVELEVIESTERFLALCVTGEAFADDHEFLKDIPVDESGERKYLLEGFLFPDTYEVYKGASEETIIDKMLTRFDQIFGQIYTARANELGMSVYEVITLASILEKEAKTFDFARVSAVFFNRMDEHMPFASDATLEYVLKTGSLHLTSEQLATPSLYNTHLNEGLPLGPISNPGDDAINAALYPDGQYLTDGYMYFCLMDPETGALVFAKTLEEHNQNVATYSPLW